MSNQVTWRDKTLQLVLDRGGDTWIVLRLHHCRKIFAIITTEIGKHNTPWSSIQAQGLSHHLMCQALSQKEGDRGEYVYVYAYLHVWYVTLNV